MEHYRRLGHFRLGVHARHARRTSDRRDLFHPLRRLGIGAPADAVGGRKTQGDRRRAKDRSSARTAASRQPNVCREIPARTCTHAAEHRGAVRLAGGRLRRGRRRRHAQRPMRARRQARDLAQRLPRRLRRRAKHGAARARHSLFRRRVAAGLYGRPHVLDPCAGADAGARLPAQGRRLPILGNQSGAAHHYHLGQRHRRIHVLDAARRTKMPTPTTERSPTPCGAAQTPISRSRCWRIIPGPPAWRWWRSATARAASI